MRRSGSDAEVERRRSDAEVAKLGRRRSTEGIGDATPAQRALGMHFAPIFGLDSLHLAVSPLLQLFVVCAASFSLSRLLRRLKQRGGQYARLLCVACVWAAAEIVRAISFQRMRQKLRKAALRTPVARKGVKPLEKP